MLSPAVMRRLMDRSVAQSDRHERARTALAALTPRELEVALAVANGRSNAEIASELAMSATAVKSHVSSILTKLGLDNRTQIALLAHDADLVRSGNLRSSGGSTRRQYGRDAVELLHPVPLTPPDPLRGGRHSCIPSEIKSDSTQL
jgi:DNA-binding CsgD family transcriptional regulator